MSRPDDFVEALREVSDEGLALIARAAAAQEGEGWESTRAKVAAEVARRKAKEAER
jgi:hypothetical protein